MTLKLLSDNKSFNGSQQVYSHYSTVCKCDMTFGLFLPKVIGPKKIPLLWFLSGLTCTHENAMTKAGAQQWAAKRGIALVFPDTSPRGETVPDHADFDLGQGAGFYLDAKTPVWSEHFKMETYIKDELSALVHKNFNLDYARQGITGHSMGGLGALNFALKNQRQFRSVSAFSPISNPTESQWGKKQFKSYLGNDPEGWQDFDPSILLRKYGFQTKILIDQGQDDNFLDLLCPQSLSDQFQANSNLGKFRLHKGYDHSYFFVSTFIEDHIDHHASILLNLA